MTSEARPSTTNAESRPVAASTRWRGRWRRPSRTWPPPGQPRHRRRRHRPPPAWRAARADATRAGGGGAGSGPAPNGASGAPTEAGRGSRHRRQRRQRGDRLGLRVGPAATRTGRSGGNGPGSAANPGRVAAVPNPITMSPPAIRCRICMRSASMPRSPPAPCPPPLHATWPRQPLDRATAGAGPWRPRRVRIRPRRGRIGR